MTENKFEDKFFARKKQLFTNSSKEELERLKVDEVACFSITRTYIALKMVGDICRAFKKRYFRNIKKVIDAMACVGGNAIAFWNASVKTGWDVCAIEMNEVRFDMLSHNMLEGFDKQKNRKNLSLVKGDCLVELEKINADVVFLDPEWGGPDYKFQDQVSLSVGDTPLADVTKKLIQRFRMIAIKVPINFAFDTFVKEVGKTCFVDVKQYQRINMLILTQPY